MTMWPQHKDKQCEFGDGSGVSHTTSMYDSMTPSTWKFQPHRPDHGKAVTVTISFEPHVTQIFKN